MYLELRVRYWIWRLSPPEAHVLKGLVLSCRSSSPLVLRVNVNELDSLLSLCQNTREDQLKKREASFCLMVSEFSINDHMSLLPLSQWWGRAKQERLCTPRGVLFTDTNRKAGGSKDPNVSFKGVSLRPSDFLIGPASQEGVPLPNSTAP